jgi:hypothetical protein
LARSKGKEENMSDYIETFNTADMPLPKERKIITRELCRSPREPNIITRLVRPPIPLVRFDWVAFREGNEESGPHYWGATEADALAELKEYEDEN